MRKYFLRSAPAKLAVAIALVLLFVSLGCGRRAAKNLQPGETLPPAIRSKGNPEAGERGEQAAAKQAVIDYLQALYKKDFSRAYDLLSEASRQGHSLSDFEKTAQQAQVVYDLARARTEKVTADGGEVIVPFSSAEEPGGKTFALVKESGTWKIVYKVGTPFSPYEK